MTPDLREALKALAAALRVPWEHAKVAEAARALFFELDAEEAPTPSQVRNVANKVEVALDTKPQSEAGFTQVRKPGPCAECGKIASGSFHILCDRPIHSECSEAHSNTCACLRCGRTSPVGETHFYAAALNAAVAEKDAAVAKLERTQRMFEVCSREEKARREQCATQRAEIERLAKELVAAEACDESHVEALKGAKDQCDLCQNELRSVQAQAIRLTGERDEARAELAKLKPRAKPCCDNPNPGHFHAHACLSCGTIEQDFGKHMAEKHGARPVGVDANGSETP